MAFFYFKIGETPIKSVTRVEVTAAPRQRVVTTNLCGNYLIDLGLVKRTVTINIAIASAAVMAVIDAAIAAGSCNISFYNDSGTEVTMSATAASVARSSPIYKNRDKTAVFYNNVRLTFEEM